MKSHSPIFRTMRSQAETIGLTKRLYTLIMRSNKPEAKRACNRAWFSAKQVENWSEMSKMTLWRWLERLEKARRISRVSDMIHVADASRTRCCDCQNRQFSGGVVTDVRNLTSVMLPDSLGRECIDVNEILGFSRTMKLY